MLTAIIPLFFDLSAKIEKTSIKVDHGMPDLAHEINFWGSSGEVIKSDFELVLSILIKSIPDKYYSMPY
jgi:hypothetical protein